MSALVFFVKRLSPHTKPLLLLRYSSSLHNFNPQSTLFNHNLPWNTIIKFVPQQQSWVVERFGKFSRVLDPGLAILIPIVERIAYVHTLKEVTVTIPSQSAITSDNVSLELDGVLYYRIIDPVKASYGIDHPNYAISQLAQTSMRAEIGRLTLDKMLAERIELNKSIVESIGSAVSVWGIECLRYEVKDIHLPELVIKSMHSQVSAERQKRATVLDSEGQAQAAINIAEGQKRAHVLESEAKQQSLMNVARANAQAVIMHANATSQAISDVSKAMNASTNGQDAVALQVAEKWVGAWSQIAKNAGSVVVVPSELGSASAMITQAMSLFKSVSYSPVKPDSSIAQPELPPSPSTTPSTPAPPSTHSPSSHDLKELNADIFGNSFKA